MTPCQTLRNDPIALVIAGNDCYKLIIISVINLKHPVKLLHTENLPSLLKFTLTQLYKGNLFVAGDDDHLVWVQSEV